MPAAGHEHREHLGQPIRGDQDRAVASHGRLGGEHVHRLGAGDARDEFEGEGADAHLGERCRLLRFVEGAQERHECGAALERRPLGRIRPAHHQHQVGGAEQGGAIGDDLGAGIRVLGVGKSGFGTGIRLDADGHVQADEGLGTLGGEGHAALVSGGFLGQGCDHGRTFQIGIGRGIGRKRRGAGRGRARAAGPV